VYRKFSRVESLEQLDELETELRDRFGPLPEPVANMVEIKRLQLCAQEWQVDDIHLEKRDVVLRYRNQALIQKLAAGSRQRLRVVDDRSAYLVGPAEEGANFDPIGAVKALLQPKRIPL
jgi:transcription-repair coupling factor (superfamily II helicase)